MNNGLGSTAGVRARWRGGFAVTSSRRFPAARVAEAKTKPGGGWVYEIVGDFGSDDAVPPTAIRGAWKVNDVGEIVGELLPNPVFETRDDSG